MKKICYISIIIVLPIFLTGCWNNEEIDKNALVHGVGFDFNEETQLVNYFVEIVKPTQGPGNEQEGGASQNVVLELESDTPLNAARELIRYAKRRLYYGHTRLWLVTEELAKLPFIPLLDVIRREQMTRLNSYVFITPDPIRDIFETPTLYENLSSDEIVSALDQSNVIAEFIPVKLYELIKMNERPIKSAHVPIITISEDESGTTSIKGTAIIKDQMMVGKLGINETIGLRMLLNNISGGIITSEIPGPESREFISLEFKTGESSIKPTLTGKDLKVEVNISVSGDLGDNIMVESRELDAEFLKEIEQLIANRITEITYTTLNKLQKELKTDVTDIGVETYRNFPNEWKEIQDIYHEEVFANAQIEVNTEVNIFHQGLTNKSHNVPQKRPYNNPYRFLDKD